MNESNHFELIDQVQDVFSIQIEYIKKYWWISLPLLIIGIVLLKIGWVYGNTRLLNTGVILLCFEIFTITIGLIFANQAANKTFMQRIASVLNFSYKEYGVIETTKAELFRWGAHKEMSNVIYGTYENMPLWIYNFMSRTGGGKNTASYRYTVFEFTYPFQVPRLISLKKSILNERVQLPEKVEVRPEGDFNKYFQLYTQKDFEKEVRQVFTPDIMALLVDEAHNVNFETCDNKIYIYIDKIITKKAQLSSMYQTAKIVSQKLVPNFESVSRNSKMV